ncbi:putative aldehyde dehydrogenase (NAD(P)(+)) [Helianthus annuus]|nr:putative aldehyde dehydrogenase (NAD(P)(+)) [Helianthus annuus]
MTEEIFGPLLPIITVRKPSYSINVLEKIEDSVEFIRSRPNPLAVYGFTTNRNLQKKMIAETSSGAITFNDAIIQVLNLHTNQSFNFKQQQQGRI